MPVEMSGNGKLFRLEGKKKETRGILEGESKSSRPGGGARSPRSYSKEVFDCTGKALVGQEKHKKNTE